MKFLEERPHGIADSRASRCHSADGTDHQRSSAQHQESACAARPSSPGLWLFLNLSRPRRRWSGVREGRTLDTWIVFSPSNNSLALSERRKCMFSRHC